MGDDLQVTCLVARASGGDRQAWDALVERYAPLVWSICRRYRLSETDAENASLTAWLQLVNHLNELGEPAALPGWLAAITHRACRRIQRAKCTMPGGGQVLAAMPDEQATTAGHELLTAERDAALREAFARLPVACQQLLGLLITEPPVPQAEISARLGLPAGSIEHYRHRYLDKLRSDPAVIRLASPEATGGR